MEPTTAEVAPTDPQGPDLDAAMVRMALEGFRSQQNLLAAVVAGLAAAVAGAVAWAIVSVVTGLQIGWLAVGVGFLVGWAVRTAGKGMDKIFGFAGAILALVGCLLGNLFIIVHAIVQVKQLSYLETLNLLRLNPGVIPVVMVRTFDLIDLLFYAIALYEGYRLSFRKVTSEELEAAVKGPSAPPAFR